MTKIQLKRVYDDAEGTPSDGLRIFVDRLWPRGESKVNFHYDIWAKDIAPTDELRKWFHENPENRWEEFRRRYLAELSESPAMAAFEKRIAAEKTVTLLYGARDTEHNNAVVVDEYLTRKLAL